MVETYFIDPSVDLLRVAYSVGCDAARWGWTLESFERALRRWIVEMELAGVPVETRRDALAIAWREYKAEIERDAQ